MIRIAINSEIIMITILVLIDFMQKMNGRIIISSTSKIKKIIEIKKKWRENGSRGLFIKSMPHSKIDSLFRLNFSLILVIMKIDPRAIIILILIKINV